MDLVFNIYCIYFITFAWCWYFLCNGWPHVVHMHYNVITLRAYQHSDIQLVADASSDKHILHPIPSIYWHCKYANSHKY